MTPTLTNDQLTAIQFAAQALNMTPEDYFQMRVNQFADQLVYEQLIPDKDTYIAMRQQVATLQAQVATLSEQVVSPAPISSPIAPTVL